MCDRSVIGGLSLAILVGCPFTDHTIRKPFAMPSAPATTVLDATFVLVVRAQPSPRTGEVIGVKRTGYGNDAGEVLLAPSVEAYVEEALTAELMRHGARVAKEASEAVALSVTVEQLFIEPDMTLWGPFFTGAMVLTAELSLPHQGPRMRRRFVAADRRWGMVMAASHYEEALQRVTEGCLAQLMVGLREALTLPAEPR